MDECQSSVQIPASREELFLFVLLQIQVEEIPYVLYIVEPEKIVCVYVVGEAVAYELYNDCC